MLTKKKLNAIQTLEELQTIGRVRVDIGYRGGTMGISSSEVSDQLGIPDELMPRMLGAFVNYLGGGIRGSIQSSTYSNEITGKKKELLDALLEAFVRVYENIENEEGLNSEEDETGETNWDALATKSARRSGISSAY
jgi:hypothetical protein